MNRPGKPAAALLAHGLHRHDDRHPFAPKRRPFTVLHVDDDDLKARTWERIARTEAFRAGLVSHPSDVTVVRARSLSEVPLGLDADAVLCDMAFSLEAGQPEIPRCGLRVLSLAIERDVPVVVISGGDRVSWWRDLDVARWPDHGAERQAIQWLMRTVAGRRS